MRLRRGGGGGASHLQKQADTGCGEDHRPTNRPPQNFAASGLSFKRYITHTDVLAALWRRHVRGGDHRIASQEKQEQDVQDESAVVHHAAKAAPLVAQQVRDQRVTQQLHALLSDLIWKKGQARLRVRYCVEALSRWSAAMLAQVD